MSNHFVSDSKPFLLFGKLLVIFNQFLLSCFHSEIGLTEGNHLLTGIAVHHNQITGVARKLKVKSKSRKKLKKFFVYFSSGGKVGGEQVV